jgi:hypothetical protein
MLIISINDIRKKLRFVAKVAVVLLMLLLVGYAVNSARPASAEIPVIITDAESDEDHDGHYPGEPIRVYNNLEDYLQDTLSGVTDSN